SDPVGHPLSIYAKRPGPDHTLMGNALWCASAEVARYTRMITLKVHHLTLYRYKRPVGFGQHRMLFRPRDSFDQRLIDWSLDIWPKPSDQYWVHDVFNNCVAVADFDTEA